jgi:hypothetical protein
MRSERSDRVTGQPFGPSQREREAGPLSLAHCGRLAAICLSTLASGVCQAQTVETVRTNAAAYLLKNQRPDGTWRTSSPDLTVLTTATAVEALLSAGVSRTNPSVAAAAAWLGSASGRSVDSEARRIAALHRFGVRSASLAAGLRGLGQPSDLGVGWGSYKGYRASFPDTALAMGALRLSPDATWNSSNLPQVLACQLLSAQRASTQGTREGWSPLPATISAPPQGRIASAAHMNASHLIATALTVFELEATRASFALGTSITCAATGNTYNAVDARNAAVDWMIAARRRSDGGFGEEATSSTFETAVVYRALAAARPAATQTTDARNYLLQRALQNGSFENDVLVTAMVLQALPPASVPLADADKDGLPDEVEQAQGTATNPGIADGRNLVQGAGDAQPGRTVPGFYAWLKVNQGVALGLPAIAGAGPSTRYGLVAGALPKGVSLDSAGVLSGIALETGSVTFAYGLYDQPGRLLDSRLAQITVTANVTIRLTSARRFARLGQPPTLTATLTPASATGAIEFCIRTCSGADLLGTVTLSGGTAALTSYTLSRGSWRVYARFTGSGSFDPETSLPIVQFIGAGPGQFVYDLISGAD